MQVVVQARCLRAFGARIGQGEGGVADQAGRARLCA